VAEDQTDRILEYEPEMRAVLRLSLETGPADGQGLPMNRGLRARLSPEEAAAIMRANATGLLRGALSSSYALDATDEHPGP
jgi:hypothetical protein